MEHLQKKIEDMTQEEILISEGYAEKESINLNIPNEGDSEELLRLKIESEEMLKLEMETMETTQILKDSLISMGYTEKELDNVEILTDNGSNDLASSEIIISPPLPKLNKDELIEFLKKEKEKGHNERELTLKMLEWIEENFINKL